MTETTIDLVSASSRLVGMSSHASSKHSVTRFLTAAGPEAKLTLDAKSS